MMDNTMFRENMKNAVNAANVECNMQTPEPGLHDLLASLGELAKENRSLSYQVRENLFGLIPRDSNSCEHTIGCAKDAIEDAMAQLAEANDFLRYISDHL